MRSDSLISDILRRHVLPYCGLVVSSRPHVTKQLHKQATLRVEILGFTEREHQHHIQKALHGQPHKIKELVQYFEEHLNIGSLCYVPFNLVVLLYLYKQGVTLPKNSALNHIIILSVLQFVNILPNMVITSKVTSPRCPICQSPVIKYSNNYQSFI